MKKNILKLTALCMLCTLFCWSCDTKNIEDDQQLSHETISTNLLNSELADIDPALLIGEWELIKFAYTADGNKISNAKTISSVSNVGQPYDKILTIRDDDPMQYISDAPLGISGPWILAHHNHFYSISGNLIKFSRFSEAMYASLLHITDEGYEVLNALTNTYSFVIKGNELIIHFTGMKNKNLLILTKR